MEQIENIMIHLLQIQDLSGNVGRVLSKFLQGGNEKPGNG